MQQMDIMGTRWGNYFKNGPNLVLDGPEVL